MGSYDHVRVEGPTWVCSEGHTCTNLQTKDLGQTMGGWTLGVRLAGASGTDGDAVELPFSGTLALYDCCPACPALFDEYDDGGGNVISPWVEFEAVIERDVLKSMSRVSASTSEQLEQGLRHWLEGPMTLDQAQALRTSPPRPGQRLRLFRKFLAHDPRDFIAEPADVALLERLLHEHPSMPSWSDEHGWSPLHCIIHGTNTRGQRHETMEALATLLIEHGADPNARDSYCETALFRAEQVRTAAWLLAHGARVDEPNAAGNTPLMLAVRKPELYQLLLGHGADPHRPNAEGRTAHDWKLLVDAGA